MGFDAGYHRGVPNAGYGPGSWTSIGLIGPPGPARSITTTALPAGKVGQFYVAVLKATGGTAPYLFTIQVGDLPKGLIMTGTKIQGTPAVTGTWNIIVFATDAGTKTQNAAHVLLLTVT